MQFKPEENCLGGDDQSHDGSPDRDQPSYKSR